MRTILFALLVASLPFGLAGPLAGAHGPGPGGPGTGEDPGLFWVRAAVAAAAAVALLLAYRARTGLLGPGLAGALAIVSHPSLPDAVAAPHGMAPLLVVLGLAAALLPAAALAARRPAGRGGVPFLAAGAASLAIAAAAGDGAARTGADALAPAVQGALAFGVLGGEAALLLVRGGGAASPRGRILLAGLALVIGGSAVAGQVRARAWTDPVAFWARAAAEVPSSPAARGALAGARAAAGDLPGAERDLRAFTEAAAAGAGRGAGEEARERGASGAAAAARALQGRQGAGEACRAALRAAREFAPANLPARVALAESLLSEGDAAAALPLLEEAVAGNGRDPAAWDGLARARLAVGAIAEALEAARQAAGLAPTEPRHLDTWARCLLEGGRGGEALELLHGALAKAPAPDPLLARAFADVEWRLAREDVSLGRRGPARRKLLAALQADRGHGACAELLAELERAMEAERPEMERLLVPRADGTVLPDDWLLYAAWLCRWGEFEAAEPHFRRLLELRGGDAVIHFHYGVEFWEGRGSADGVRRAVSAYQQAIALRPDYADAWNRLWQCQRLLGRLPEAREAARRFAELAPAHPDAAAAQLFLEGP